jgi:hypothetical protein
VCGKRAVADVSADADPNTGVSVYDTYASQGMSGWLVFGGTSVASPIVASVCRLAGDALSIDGSFPYGPHQLVERRRVRKQRQLRRKRPVHGGPGLGWTHRTRYTERNR